MEEEWTLPPIICKWNEVALSLSQRITLVLYTHVDDIHALEGKRTGQGSCTFSVVINILEAKRETANGPGGV